MTADPRLIALAEKAYEAALDDDLWRSWSEQAVSTFESDGGLFWVIDTERADMCRSYFLFPDTDERTIGEEYLSGPVQNDPQMARVCAGKRSEIYLDIDHVDLEDAISREYVAWQEARVGTCHHMTAAVVLDDSFRAGISLHRSRESGVTPVAQRRRLDLLFPHFTRALRLGMRHHQALQEAWWDGLTAQRGKAMLVLDDRGRILRASCAAETALARPDGLTVRDGRLHANESSADARLQELVRRAIVPIGSQSGIVAIPRRSAAAPYWVTIFPLVRRRRFMAPFGAAALVHVACAQLAKAKLPSLHREMFSLTDREVQVVELLLAGHSPESLAATLGISALTARVHLRTIFRKTHTNRQVDLVRLFLSID